MDAGDDEIVNELRRYGHLMQGSSGENPWPLMIKHKLQICRMNHKAGIYG